MRTNTTTERMERELRERLHRANLACSDALDDLNDAVDNYAQARSDRDMLKTRLEVLIGCRDD